jgi:hypothetical protein
MRNKVHNSNNLHEICIVSYDTSPTHLITLNSNLTFFNNKFLIKCQSLITLSYINMGTDKINCRKKY